MGKRSDRESEDRWQMIFAGAVVLLIALLWPARYKPPYPWDEPIFLAALWSSIFIIICKSLLTKWRFWISLAFGIAAQVWVTKSLIMSGVHMRRPTDALMALIGMIVWGVAYLLLTQISRSLGFEESKNKRRERY